ncbi:hypothetical protein F4781DRAFT_31008 [Annulohypoxylon bovei var. microspora]|nr:hypothetical protein F4781DRAFT_31008 [Annulohypoxylon bovei var. microspora]
MSNYPYAPPPPAPSAASPSPYPSYSQGSGYSHPAPRGSHVAATTSGRSHAHHQGPGRSEYSSSYYPQQNYSSPSGGPYNPPQPASYWQGAPPSSHAHSNGSSIPPSYTPSYAPQGYPQPSQPYQAPYPSQPSRPPYGGAPYGQAPSEYVQPPQQWSDQGQAYPSYPSRGGRGAYPSDRSGPLRNPYPPTHHQPAPLQPPYGYPPTTTPSFPGPPQPHYGSSNRGHGRGGHSHSTRGAHGMSSDRGEKFRHRDQKPHQPPSYQKSDPATGKKKKRKTNTLGLTPDEDDSDKGGDVVDDEKRLAELFGSDGPGIPDGDLGKWLAERRANFPTKTRIAQKEAELHSELANHANNGNEPAPVQVDPVEKEADRLRKRLAKLDRKIEKRKRAPNDEGDDMRSESSDEESDDEKPEALPTDKSATGFLPPPPITRADPSNHCKYYSTGGICGKKGKCRFVHDPAVREAALQERTRNGGQMTLKQRLLLNDKEQDDMEVIKTIVDMRCNGRLHNPQNSHSHSHLDELTMERAGVPVVSSLPTTGGEANLPPNPFAHLKNRKPLKKHNDWPSAGQHQGWNPPGYGGAGMPPK